MTITGTLECPCCRLHFSTYQKTEFRCPHCGAVYEGHLKEKKPPRERKRLNSGGGIYRAGVKVAG